MVQDKLIDRIGICCLSVSTHIKTFEERIIHANLNEDQVLYVATAMVKLRDAVSFVDRTLNKMIELNEGRKK